jgi:hypothetical protein
LVVPEPKCNLDKNNLREKDVRSITIHELLRKKCNAFMCSPLNPIADPTIKFEIRLFRRKNIAFILIKAHGAYNFHRTT